MSFRTLVNDLFNRGERGNAPVQPSELDRYERQEQEIIARIDTRRKMQSGIGRFLKHPFEVLTETPTNSLIATLPLAFSSSSWAYTISLWITAGRSPARGDNRTVRSGCT